MNNLLICFTLLLLTSCSTNEKPAEVISSLPTKTQVTPVIQKTEYYLVRNGDTVASVSKRFGVSQAELLKLNKLSDGANLVPGQRLLLKPRNKQEEQKLADDIVAKPLDDLSQPVTDESGIIEQPSLDKPSLGHTSNQTIPSSGGGYRLPVQGKIVKAYGQQPDGSFNKGINIAAPKGVPVKAVSDGVVKYAGSKAEGYGKMVMIKHADGKISTYAHLNTIDVKSDAVIAAGAKIGTIGSTGNVSQPQLNLQIRGTDKMPIDPTTIIPGLG